MNDNTWREFFNSSAKILGGGTPSIETSTSWCSWTTFSRLKSNDAGYWTCGLPAAKDIGEYSIRDGGVWGQPFHFSDLAHFILPKQFFTLLGTRRQQNIEALSLELDQHGVNHELKDYLLEIKLY